MQNEMDDLIEAINATADTSFDASAPTNTDASVPTNSNGDPITCPVVLNLLANPRFFTRLSGSTTTGFLDGERKLGGITNEPLPKYFRMHCTPNAEDKRGAYQLQEEYLAGRLGKNDEENSRLWNTVLWINKHYRVWRTPPEALPPLNIYVGDKISQSTEGTGAPTGSDDEAPDEAGNEGVEFEDIFVGDADGQSSMCVMDEDGTTHLLDIKTDDYDLLRLIDALEEIDKLAKIDVDDLKRDAPPLLPQTDFPSSDQRAESGKIIRTLMLGMRTLWPPVIRAIASHADMKSLSQGKGKDVAAAVGRARVIEGLRLAESIRKGLGRQDREFSMWQSQTRARQEVVPSAEWGRSNRFKLGSVEDIITETLAILPEKSLPIQQDNDCEGRLWPARWGLAVLPNIIKTAPVVSMPMIVDFDPVKTKPLAGNDNFQSDSADRKAA